MRSFLISALLLFPVVVFAQATSIQNFLTSLLTFLNDTIIPFLLVLAFLFFIVNVVRFFILGATEDEGRKNARALAIWGISAFVFIAVLWGIVNLIVEGLEFDNGDFQCPDYFAFFRSDCDRSLSVSAPSGTTFTGNRFVVDPEPERFVAENSELALFLYGSLRESISFTDNTLSPGATGRVVAVASDASCQAGFDLLTLAAERESSEAAYILYESNLTGTTWLNVTDSTTLRFASFDADTIAAERAGLAGNLALIHTHQERALGTLPLSAFPPSISDLNELCNSATGGDTHVVVDQSGVWTLRKSIASCPYNDTDRQNIGVAVALNALAHIPADFRETELADLIVSPIVPDRDASALEDFQDQNLGNLSTAQVRALATALLAESGITIERTSTSNFCSSF